MSSETKNFIRRRHVTVDLSGPETVLVSVHDYKLANRCRAVLGQHEYRLKPGEEWMHKCHVTKLRAIAPILNITDLATSLETNFRSGRLARVWAACITDTTKTDPQIVQGADEAQDD